MSCRKSDCWYHIIMTAVSGKVCVPRQLVIIKDPSSIPDAVIKAGLGLPLGTPMFCLLFFFFLKFQVNVAVCFISDENIMRT